MKQLQTIVFVSALLAQLCSGHNPLTWSRIGRDGSVR